MTKPPDKAYCISCGEQVPVRLISIGIEGEDLLQCAHCNSFLGTTSQPQSTTSSSPLAGAGVIAAEPVGEFRPDETQGGAAILPDLPTSMETPQDAGGGIDEVQVEPAEPEAETQAGPPLDTVITVEDSSLISAILNDILVEQGLTKKVLPCKNGYEFLARFVRERRKKTGPGLVFMDVKMPVLNGVSAAVAMRTHEKAGNLEPVPILFFTSKRCDETFRKVLVHCAPAMYINKGTSSSPENLQERITKIVHQLLREEW